MATAALPIISSSSEADISLPADVNFQAVNPLSRTSLSRCMTYEQNRESSFLSLLDRTSSPMLAERDTIALSAKMRNIKLKYMRSLWKTNLGMYLKMMSLKIPLCCNEIQRSGRSVTIVNRKLMAGTRPLCSPWFVEVQIQSN